MTKLEKLIEVNNHIQEMTINTDLGFFTRILPEKMEEFLKLTYFDVDDVNFQTYINDYREALVLSTIDWCKKTKLNESELQKEYTLFVCKRCIHDFLSIIKTAFVHYLGDLSEIQKEEI